ncbi:hypothetical protein FA13DRAFT_1302108 [Coprinellus micaceus]|uniref:Uncharacterized protein n=1 Tax=Coprinellus micaceus TaxID=71717 RepID=A0A4Y7R5T1_COPMI|nr:hypothetical protein FA13DRAFT_1302108 [Coprinellus micaceus]
MHNICCHGNNCAKWNANSDSSLLRALNYRFGGVPERNLPSKKSIRSIRRHMLKETGNMWFSHEVEHRIRRLMIPQRRQPTVTPTRQLSPCEACSHPQGRTNQPRDSVKAETPKIRRRATLKTPRGSRPPYQQGASRLTRWGLEGDWQDCCGHSGLGAFNKASDFEVGTVNIHHTSCRCGKL